MRRSPSVALFVALLAIAGGLAAFARANGDEHATTVNVEAQETADCAAGKTFCWDVSGFAHAGGSITFALENAAGHSDHNFYVTVGDDHEQGGNSDASAAEQHAQLPAGATAEVALDVPTDATEIYFWCEVAGHEGLGMWHKMAVEGGNGGSTDDDASSPAVGLFAALVGISLAAFALSRRR